MVLDDVENLRGELIIVTGIVNSGKTEGLIMTTGKLLHSRYSNDFMVFTNSRNTRDSRKRLVSSSGLKFDNVYVADAEDPDKIHEIIASQTGKADIVIFDEGNLHGPDFVPVVTRLMRERRVVVVYGLNMDFRGEAFGPMGRLEEIARTRETVTGKKLVFRYQPYCKVAKPDGTQCSQFAGYNLRLVKIIDPKIQEEVKYFDLEGSLVSGFTKAPYYGPTIIVEGSKKGVAYTTACPECFGEIPGKDLVMGLLSFVQQGGKGGRGYEEIAERIEDPVLPEVIAYTVEERRLDIYSGQYTINTIGSHLTSEEVAKLMYLGKELDEPGSNATLDIHQFIRGSSFAKRNDVKEKFGSVRNLERILSGLMMANFATLRDARLSITPHVKDAASGMYVPFDSI